MTVPERLAFARQLESALAAREPAREVAELLRSVFVTEWPPDDRSDQWLVRKVAERIDAHTATGGGIIGLATDVQKLLSQASSDETVELLVDLVIERERFASVARKYLTRTISRTSFLSFVAEQSWPAVVRRRVSTLPDAELGELTNGLERQDFVLVERTIGT